MKNEYLNGSCIWIQDVVNSINSLECNIISLKREIELKEALINNYKIQVRNQIEALRQTVSTVAKDDEGELEEFIKSLGL